MQQVFITCSSKIIYYNTHILCQRRYVIVFGILYKNYIFSNPHIGHLYTALIADAYHRWQLLRHPNEGPTSLFVTGTDEHGNKIQNAAIQAGISPNLFVNEYSGKFKELFKQFNISNTDYIRTTEERHKNAVQHLWVCCVNCFDKKNMYQ